MSIEAPQHTIQVRHEITDGPIPKASFNYETFQLSFDWRQLYTIFYGEMELTTRLDESWVRSQESKMAALREKMMRGELDMMAVFMEAATSFDEGNEANIKKARRARMKYQHRLIGLEDWDPDTDGGPEWEEQALEKLKRRRQFIDFEDMSDEEGDGAKSDEDESEAEWEDEDEDEEEDDDAVGSDQDMERG